MTAVARPFRELGGIEASIARFVPIVALAIAALVGTGWLINQGWGGPPGSGDPNDPNNPYNPNNPQQPGQPGRPGQQGGRPGQQPGRPLRPGEYAPGYKPPPEMPHGPPPGAQPPASYRPPTSGGSWCANADCGDCDAIACGECISCDLDCLSGMDCSAVDCGDCSNVDCSGCDGVDCSGIDCATLARLPASKSIGGGLIVLLLPFFVLGAWRRRILVRSSS